MKAVTTLESRRVGEIDLFRIINSRQLPWMNFLLYKKYTVISNFITECVSGMYCIAFNILHFLLYTLYNNELKSNVIVNTLFTVMCVVFIDKDFKGFLPNTQLTDGMMTAQSLS